MDTTYYCPDCRTEHDEPFEAVLGHVARCHDCVMLLELLAEEQSLHARIREIRLAA